MNGMTLKRIALGFAVTPPLPAALWAISLWHDEGSPGIAALGETFLDVLPFLGSMSRTGLGFLTFGVAVFFTIITVFISAILHNIVALIVILLLFVGLGVWIARRQPPVQPKMA